MPFRDNSILITDAATIDVVANGSDDVYSGAGGATAFVIADGNVGDDQLLNFDNDDSLINGRRIFDGNNDGFIAFGANGVLDVDRTAGGNSSAARGPDQLQLVGTGDDIVLELRYLGVKGGNHVYADSSTLRNLAGAFGDTNLNQGDATSDNGNSVVEGTVADDTINAADGAKVILHDNTLGLNLGGDTINGFGDDDLLAFTAPLFDSEGNGDVKFFSNLVLDVSSAAGPDGSDPSTGPGGQIDLNEPDQTVVVYKGSATYDGVIYYFYGTENSTAVIPGLDA